MKFHPSILMFAAMLSLAASGNALAAQRTFVATTGADAHTAQNCSLASPCRSFVAAMSVTDDKGEVIVLDSGGYGAVSITQSVRSPRRQACMPAYRCSRATA